MAASVSEVYNWDITVTKGGSPVSGAAVIAFNAQDSQVVDQTTGVDGRPTGNTAIQAASHSVTGFVTTTTDRNPLDIRVVNYGDIAVYFDKQLTEPSEDAVFLVTDTVITETNKATVAAYTGFSVALDFIINLFSGTWNPERLYDRCQVDNEDNPVAGRFALFESVDGVNFISADGVGVNCDVNFDADGTSWTMTGTGQWTALSGSSFSNGTINQLDIGTSGSDTMTGTTVTDLLRINGSNRTLTFTNCTIDKVDTLGAEVNITINLNNSSIATNLDPTNITINNSVTVRVDGVAEGTSVKVIANETVGTVTKGDVILETFADSNGVAERTDFNYETAFEPSGLDVLVRARNQGIAVAAIAEDGGVFTDETEEANSAATGDMTLTPATPAVNDAYYFGAAETFDAVKVIVDATVTGQSWNWEYYNGTGWSSLSGVSVSPPPTFPNQALNTAGEQTISWTVPGNWATTTINSQGPLYYIRARIFAITTPNQSTGRQCQLNTALYLPIPPSGVLERTITSAGLTATLSQAVDSISRPFG